MKQRNEHFFKSVPTSVSVAVLADLAQHAVLCRLHAGTLSLERVCFALKDGTEERCLPVIRSPWAIFKHW